MLLQLQLCRKSGVGRSQAEDGVLVLKAGSCFVDFRI